MENNTSFDRKQTDGFNEVAELGLNSSAEILSKLLNKDVEINTRSLDQEQVTGLESFGDEPGLAVELELSGAISGKAAVVAQNVYIKEIIKVLMSADSDGGDSSDELDEIAVGTFKELIGQVSSAFAESLTDFLGSEVRIKAGQAEEISDECLEVADFLGIAPEDECLCLVSDFTIKDALEGNFVIAIAPETFESTVSAVMSDDEDEDEGDYEGDDMDDGSGLNIPGGFDMGAAVNAAKSFNRSRGVMKNGGGINVQNASFPSFAGAPNGSGIPLLNGNIDLLMDVPLNVTIEIGKTRKKMREIMEFSQGTIIDLEKQAGAPVDVVVNGQLIARGDVVVIDDNFGVRITEIIGNNAFAEGKN